MATIDEKVIGENRDAPASKSKSTLSKYIKNTIAGIAALAMVSQAEPATLSFEKDGYKFGKTVFVDKSCKFTVMSDYLAMHIINGKKRRGIHLGLDITLTRNFEAARGTLIKSPGYGVVLAAGDTVFGKGVIVGKWNGLTSKNGKPLYNVIQLWHLDEILVKVGDEVGPTDDYKPIGKMGNTGAASGVHLHLGYVENVERIIKSNDARLGSIGLNFHYINQNGNPVYPTNPNGQWYNPKGQVPITILYFEKGKDYSKEAIGDKWLWPIVGDCGAKKVTGL